MSRYFPAEITIEFPDLGSHIEIHTLTKEQARRYKKHLEAGNFSVRMFVEEKREVS